MPETLVAPAAPTPASAPITESRSESSPSIPRDPKGYADWRAGKTPSPETKPKSAAPAPAKKDTPSESPAPDSETGNDSQEKKTRSNADTRLTEILDDLRKAGLSPSQLKTYRVQAQKAEEQGKDLPKPPTETTAKPAASDAKKAPKLEDFKTYDEYIDAKAEFIADAKATTAIEGYKQQLQREAAAKSMQEKIDVAKARYGDEAENTIGEAAKGIFSDKDVAPIVKELLKGSPVFVDLLYTIGSKPEDMAAFINEAKTNPGAAIRRAVLFEKLVQEELAGVGKKASAEDSEDSARDSSGQFVSKTPPAKKVTSAPPPPPRSVWTGQRAWRCGGGGR